MRAHSIFLILVIAVILFTGCSETHDWIPATCISMETCRICGETRGQLAEHTWQGAACTEKATCRICGAECDIMAEHQWTEASCTECSFCSICGEKRGAPLSHSWANATVDTSRICLVCGLTEGEPLVESEPQHAVQEQYIVGNLIQFGTYEQDGNIKNGPEPITWRILQAEENRIFLISELALATQPFHNSYICITWESCSLRTWLNTEFFEEAFSETEQNRIILTNIHTPPNPIYRIDGGKDAEDRIFLLSMDEVLALFPDANDRVCHLTAVAAAPKGQSAGDSCWWWLRSRGDRNYGITGVAVSGDIYDKGYGVGIPTGAVRPVLWLNIGEAD